METKKYMNYIIETMGELRDTQADAIDKASEFMIESCAQGGRVYIFGSGHSHLVAEEMYVRAGGLALTKGILPDELMLHGVTGKSTQIERLDGYAKPILMLHKPAPEDTLIVVSNSGRNNVPVEMCLAGKELGMKVVAITSMKHSSAVTSRHHSGLRMFEIADVTIDNLAVAGDADYYVENFDVPTGPISDIMGLTIAQTLVVNTVDGLVRRGIEPPVFKSSNLDGADAYNNELFDKYFGYWK